MAAGSGWRSGGEAGPVEFDGLEAEGPAPGPAPRSGRSGAPDRLAGFAVEGAGPGLPAVQVLWKSVSGGAPNREFAPGAAYLSDLTLVGYMTPTRKALFEWMNAASGGESQRRQVTITPVKIDGAPGGARASTPTA